MTFEEALDELDSRVQSAKEQQDWLTFWDLLDEVKAMHKLRSDGYA
tara:strand:- start:1374 stop:1511 length:138 start_codon:yes stop_codon:yes gene_type:complete